LPTSWDAHVTTSNPAPHNEGRTDTKQTRSSIQQPTLSPELFLSLAVLFRTCM
jgi:hypothetical protein